ncbi:MAG: cell division protein FtsW, partial [Armatimonadetes bacterium]|nr:cell division protein FtsW [Armatimonadota bacterium]
RWLTLGPLSFQPMEAAKLAFILYMARFLAFRGLEVREWRRGLLPPLLILGAFSGLALAQRDLGSALLMGIITMVMLFAGGARVLHLMTLTAVGMPTVFAAIRMQEYRWKRVIAFLNPWRDPQGTGFQIIQSLLALGSGGILGVGLGQSQQKFFYLPERHTDFIFAIVGEELGLLGTGFVLLLYLVFTYRGMLIAQRAPDRYGTLLAAGITAGITTQAMLNIGVISGVLPVTGVPLPFISFGGSSLVITSIGVGILLNISQYTTGWERRDEHAADDRGRRDGRPHLPRPRRR